MVHKLNDVKKIVYLRKVLLKFSKKDIIIRERKVKDQIRKIASQKKHPKENLPKIWVYMNHAIFLNELSRLQKFSENTLERVYGRSLQEHFLQAFFQVFFLRPRRKYTAKILRRNSVNENSSKFRRNANL